MADKRVLVIGGLALAVLGVVAYVVSTQEEGPPPPPQQNISGMLTGDSPNDWAILVDTVPQGRP